MRFTYENQGTETMLVWKLEEEEHLDSLAKGMLQGNEIEGILKPAFMQRDRDQYLKYPVTSKITLEDYISGEMEKETLLKILVSFTGAVKEISDYMLSPEKLVFSPEYVFVDIRKKTVGLVYLPVDEFAQDVSLKEFLAGLLSHMRFKEEEDLSYVAKLLSFLNQPDPWEAEALQHYLEQLLIEKKTKVQKTVVSKTAETSDEVVIRKAQPVIQQPVSAVQQSAASISTTAQVVNSSVAQPVTPQPASKAASHPITPPSMPPIPGVPQSVPVPAIPGTDTATDKKKKEKHLIDLFKKPSKNKEAVPSAEEKKPEPEKKKEKKSLFGKDKKKKEKAPIVPEVPVFGNIPGVKPEEPVNIGIPVPNQEERRDNPPEKHFFREEVKTENQIQPENYGNTGYAGHGSSEDEEHTVIMGGGVPAQSTVILGYGEPEQKQNGEVQHSCTADPKKNWSEYDP